MFLKTLTVEGYKCFGKKFQVHLSKGLNVLVGENGSGKTAIIDAIRLLLLEDEYGRGGVKDTDFHLPFTKGATRSTGITITALFDGLAKEESVAFLPWVVDYSQATLNLEVENKETTRGFRPVRWGGVSRASMFEHELFDRINCIYLPPMRDAEAKLREGKGSRLARLLKNLNQRLVEAGTPPLVEEVKQFNKALASDQSKSIHQANTLIRTALSEAVGKVFGQDTLIQFGESNFNRIAENLRLVFFPRFNEGTDGELFRSLEENSLGYNNLLYLATVLAELQNPGANDDYLRVLLIEEPEAHLHPQLQIRLLKYLERTAAQSGIQVIVTTHSPVLASAVSLNTMIHLSSHCDGAEAVALRDCGLTAESEAFISRWLDATKSTLLFAKSVILVEGIAEALLLPELAKIVLKTYNEGCNPLQGLPESLEDAGVTVINMNGIYFKHFMQLFCSFDAVAAKKLIIRCAGITDLDPPTDSKPTPTNLLNGTNPALTLVDTVSISHNARLYVNRLKTFEYDLAMEGQNLKVMLALAARHAKQNGHPRVAKQLGALARSDWSQTTGPNIRADAAFELLVHIEKGEYAQLLAKRLSTIPTPLAIPDYITRSVLWACGISA
jgi:predicted ATP-dependent endonuclease of OLD family